MQSNSVLRRGYTLLTTVPVGDLQITGPVSGSANVTYVFTAATNLTATAPITYEWLPSGQPALFHYGGGVTDTARLSWAAEGVQTVTVTATNALGTASRTHAITLTGSWHSVYLPVVLKH